LNRSVILETYYQHSFREGSLSPTSFVSPRDGGGDTSPMINNNIIYHNMILATTMMTKTPSPMRSPQTPCHAQPSGISQGFH
jgi:hypothetical protein